MNKSYPDVTSAPAEAEPAVAEAAREFLGEACSARAEPAPMARPSIDPTPVVRVQVETENFEIKAPLCVIPDPDLSHLALQINNAHSAAMAAAKTTLKHAIKCGDLLADAKRRFAHGKWLSWLNESCPHVRPRTAQRYMQLSDSRSDIQIRLGDAFDATIMAGVALISKPRAERTRTMSKLPAAAKAEERESVGVAVLATEENAGANFVKAALDLIRGMTPEQRSLFDDEYHKLPGAHSGLAARERPTGNQRPRKGACRPTGEFLEFGPCDVDQMGFEFSTAPAAGSYSEEVERRGRARVRPTSQQRSRAEARTKIC
jgi:hypothetical protein